MGIVDKFFVLYIAVGVALFVEENDAPSGTIIFLFVAGGFVAWLFL